MLKKVGFLVALAVAVARIGVDAAPVADSQLARIDDYVAPLVAADQLSGTLLVARGDDVLYERSFGIADAEHDLPNRPDLPSCIASITKPMTLTIAIKLMEEGKVQPGDTLRTWFPEFPQGDRITFLDVLRHRAGFPHRVTTPAEEKDPITTTEMVERVSAYVAANGLLCEPGEKSIYSSAGYSVAARICELVAGEPFDRLLEEVVFEPAGMAHSFSPTPGEALPPHAKSYTDSWPGIQPAPDKDYSFLVGAGSVFSTAHDVYGFLHAIVDTTYGASVLASLDREGGIHENGITNGYRAFADYVDSTDTYVVFAGNRFTGATDWLREDVPRILAGEDVPSREIPRITRVSLTDEQCKALEGAWESENGGASMDVTVRDGQVYAGWYALIPTSPTTFFAPEGYGTATFQMKEGRAWRLEWVMPDSSSPPLVWTRRSP